jgi:hypothetical protein
LRKIRFVERLKINGEEGICTQDFSEEAWARDVIWKT